MREREKWTGGVALVVADLMDGTLEATGPRSHDESIRAGLRPGALRPELSDYIGSSK